MCQFSVALQSTTAGASEKLITSSLFAAIAHMSRFCSSVSFFIDKYVCDGRVMAGYVAGKRNVVYAGDAGRGLVRVCEDGHPGERYLICGENLTMQQLMAKIAAVTGAPEPREIPLAAAKLVSAWQTFKYKHLHGPAPKVSPSAIAVMSSGQYLDGSRATRELGYRPEVSVDEAIRRALEWFRSQGKVKNR